MNTYYKRFLTPMERFEECIEVEPGGDGCWIWTKRLKRGPMPYGQWTMNGKPISAHRAAYTIYVGEIPPRQSVLHSCDRPQCVNPRHLFLGTQLHNMQDMIVKGRKRVHRGSAHSMAKLSLDDVLTIKRSTSTCKSLADQYGVCAMTISRIRTGKRWAHVKA